MPPASRSEAWLVGSPEAISREFLPSGGKFFWRCNSPSRKDFRGDQNLFSRSHLETRPQMWTFVYVRRGRVLVAIEAFYRESYDVKFRNPPNPTWCWRRLDE
jgi:hypothetical protein